MAKFDRYLLSQLMVLFGFFALVLVMVYWVNGAVVLFDQLIANGQSAMVFLEFTTLTLPNVIRLVLPMAAFGAAVYSANRMSSESELVVVQATGYSPYRLARPVMIFGLIVGVLLSVLTHYLVPTSKSQLAERKAEIEDNFTARFLREGVFLHPSPGVTLYIRDINSSGELLDVFLSNRNSGTEHANYSARKALFVSDADGPKLLMFDGVVQQLNLADQRLFTTSFTDFVFDVSAIIGENAGVKLKPQELPTAQLLWPDEQLVAKARTSRAILLQTGHERFSEALFGAMAALVGFSALLMGGFSRFGLWRQIMVAVVLVVILKSLDNFMNDFARRDENLWPLVYFGSIAGVLTGFAMLWLSARPALFSRRSRGQTA